MPYENRIGVAWLTLPELREILEENAAQKAHHMQDIYGELLDEHTAPNLHHMLGVYGVTYDLCTNAPPNQRVRNLRLADGVQPPPEQRLAVAMNSHTLASGGGRYPSVPRLVASPQARFVLTTNDTRSAVVEYIRNHSPLRIDNPPLVRVIQ